MPLPKPPKSLHDERFFGSCAFARNNQGTVAVPEGNQALNILLSFSETLKLKLALEEGLLKLNRYNKNTMEGRRCALKITIQFGNERILVNEDKLPQQRQK
jgi:hypothetical protein